jgi:uncharacterized protein
MEELKNWGISLEDIPLEGLKVEFADVKVLEGFKIKKPLFGFFKLKKLGIEVKLEGFISGSLVLECDRCLTEFEFDLEHSFALDLKPLTSLNFEEEKELSDEEMEVSFFENSWISFYDILREEIWLSIPYKKLCRENCKGLCPSCGVNLNERSCSCGVYKKESPFAVLKQMIEKESLEKRGGK